MRGASFEDWCFLTGFGKLRENLNVYNHDTRSVVVAGDIVPWPVTWVLARYNRKHRWCFPHDLTAVLCEQLWLALKVRLNGNGGFVTLL